VQEGQHCPCTVVNGRSIAAAVAAALLPQQSFGAALRSLTVATTEIEAVTGRGAAVALEKAAVNELAGSLRGNLLLTGSEGYDIARRVMNASIDKYPALVVQPTGVADIQQAINFARERDLLLAVKCGGHSGELPGPHPHHFHRRLRMGNRQRPASFLGYFLGSPGPARHLQSQNKALRECRTGDIAVRLDSDSGARSNAPGCGFREGTTADARHDER
jgi:hypothetical protein